MNAEQRFAARLAQYQNDPEYLTEELLLDVTEQISIRLHELGLRPADLAERLGVSRAYVSQMMAGKPNMTLRTMVNVALALNQHVAIKLEDRVESFLDLTPYRPVTVTLESHDDNLAVAS